MSPSRCVMSRYCKTLMMGLHVFFFLLVVCLLLSLARLGRLCWFSLRPSSSRGRAKRSTLHRLLKPRTPDDCPACRMASPASSVGGPAPAAVRPWPEVKSRRGAPKRVNTEGYACPNRTCPYFGITDAHIHALVGDGKHGQAERIQTFRGPACHTTFSARRHTPLYRLKTPSHQIAVVLSALAEGLDLSAAERVFGYRQATITAWLTRAGEHAQTLHEHCFHHLWLPHLQLDELRTRLRSSQQVLWLWLAIDPCTKLLPVLRLGPRTQHMAHLLIHTLRQMLAAFLPPPFHQRWLESVFLCADSPFWTLAQGWSPRTPVAGGSGLDLRPSEKMLSAAQAGSRDARDAPWDSNSSSGHLARTRPVWTAEHGFHRACESDGASWGSSTSASHLGHSEACSTPTRSHGMVASLLPFCASSCITASGPCAASRTRGQTSGTTLSPTYPGNGRRQNEATMDGQ